jgi:predicted site-specific integrase-resolvase
VVKLRSSPRYLSLDEAVTSYGISKSSLHRWVRDGRLKRFRKPLDRRAFVEVAALEKLIKHPLANGG